MCESSGLASASVNGNSDINDVSNIAEELVEISIRHFECKVTDEEGLGGRVRSVFTCLGCLVVDHKAASFVNGLVLRLNGCGCLLGSFKFNVSETVEISVSYNRNESENAEPFTLYSIL